MDLVPNPTPPRRSSRIRRAKEEKDVPADDITSATVVATGPSPWTEAELQIFLDGLKQFGTAWKKIASTLKNRTPQMIEDLYNAHANYLTVAPDSSPVSIFYSIVQDQYRREQMMADMEGEEDLAAVVLAEGHKESALMAGGRASSPRRSLSPRQKSKKHKASSSVPPASKKTQPAGTPIAVVMTPERKRVPTRLFTSPVSKSSRRKATSTPKQTPTKKQKTSQNQSQSAGPPKSTRVLRTRKAAAEAETDASNGGTPSPASSDGLPLKLREKLLKGKMGESPAAAPKKKKSSSSGSRRKNTSESASAIAASAQSQLQTFLNSTKALNWCMYEWFYPDIDKPFFDINDFQNCLNSTGVGCVTALTRVEWGFIRTVFGKARRFSPAFLNEEREKLKGYRESIRQLRNNKSPVNRAAYQIPYVPPPLPLSTRVVAFHPDTRQLQLGTIVAVEYSRFKVEFDNKDLGTEWIPDTDVMAHEGKDWPPRRSSQNASPRTPVRQLPPLSPLAGLTTMQQIEVSQLYDLIKLLKQKEELIKTLRKMNDEAEKMSARSERTEFPTEFQRYYALAIKKLSEVNEAIKPRLLNLRSRTPQASPGIAANSNSASPWPASLFPGGVNGVNTTTGQAATGPAVTPAGSAIPSPGTDSNSPSSFSSSSSSAPSITLSSPSSSSTAINDTTTTTTTTTTSTTTTTITTPDSSDSVDSGSLTEESPADPMEVEDGDAVEASEDTTHVQQPQQQQKEEQEEEEEGEDTADTLATTTSIHSVSENATEDGAPDTPP